MPHLAMFKSRGLALVVSATVLALVAGGGGAMAAKLITSGDIQDKTIKKIDLHKNAVETQKVKDGSLRLADLDKKANDTIKKAGTASLTVNKTSGPTTVAFIGGSFATRATVATTYTLPVGTHQISTDGFFISNVATSGLTRLEVAVRGPAGEDFGTCFTGLASVLAQREATCSTTRVVTVAQDTLVTVYVFGYADDQGEADNAKFNATTASSALKVG